ncbi:MAG TPA: hypothetical protein VE549_04120 [Myxococcaceae bacterium]|nr:hypothetical protein [Myxococcaceae bacterium]
MGISVEQERFGCEASTRGAEQRDVAINIGREPIELESLNLVR